MNTQGVLAKWQLRAVIAERKLAIIAAIDKIRDNIPEPVKMREAIARSLVKEFGALGCIIGLTDEKEHDGMRIATVAGDNLKECGEQYWKDLMGIGRQIAKQGRGTDRVVILDSSLNMMATLVQLHNEILGVIVLVREEEFLKEDLAILESAESQIDSAIIQSREFYRLVQKEKVIEAIKRIDAIRDEHLPFEKMLAKVVKEIRKIIPGEDSAILLCNTNSTEIELSAVTNRKLLRSQKEINTLLRTAKQALDERELQNWNAKGEKLHSLICLPLVLQDKIIGVIAAINRIDGEAFNKDDEELLQAIGDMLDTAIFEGIESARIKAAFSRSVSPSVMDLMLECPTANLVKPQRRDVSIVFADVRNSTALAEETNPEVLTDFLNEYFENLSHIIMGYGGMIDKFVGDEIMAIFNAPLDQPDYQLRAVKTALAMQKAHGKILEKWSKVGINNRIGVGVSSGISAIGEIGCEIRTDYTAIGRVPNWGSRLCGSAKGGQILICPTTYEAVKDRVKAIAIPEFTFKGLKDATTVYSLTGLA